MKKYALFIGIMLLALSCKKENEVQEKVAAIPVGKVEIDRFDKAFFDAGPQGLPGLKEQYPFLFPAGNDDAVWINKMKDPFMLKLKDETDKAFPNVTGLEEDFASLFQHVKYYYPNLPVPKVITLISDDVETKSVYANDLVLVPLSLYLGKDNYLYEGLPRYQVQSFEPSQILPDVVSSFGEGKIAYPKDRTLLGLMIYFGKELYIKDLLLPDTPDEHKIAYTKEQLEWAKVNEIEIWRYFVENKLLYDTDPKLPARFINPAPFSKFYLELDNESPGRVGQWLGWQIVRAYADNNKNVSLSDLLAKDAKEIFENSKYKPKK